ncbi:nucleotidyltransferase family protein [Nakamurella silvestris]|nr:nucleotidyltransferase family protein [Nakamurella silvestris]
MAAPRDTDAGADPGGIAGVVLAAGAGRRYGRAKVLVDEGDGPWGPRTAALLSEAGCEPVLVVLGAEAAAARMLFDGTTARLIDNPDWATGMASSLRCAIEALERGPSSVEAAVLMLVDLPEMTAGAVKRVMVAAGSDGLRNALFQASFDGVPGHPVLLGRNHWAGAAASATGDNGARGYLSTHPAQLVEVADLAGGTDRDTPLNTRD